MKIEQRLNSIYNSGLANVSNGFLYPAIVDFAETFAGSTQEEFEFSFSKLFNENQLTDISSNLNTQRSKFLKILSYGNYWNDDELLLIYTYLIQFNTIKILYAFNEINLDFSHEFEFFNSNFTPERHEKELNYVKRKLSKNCDHLPLKLLLKDQDFMTF